jgi:hypothetical protein
MSLALVLVWGCSVEYVTVLAPDGATVTDGATGDMSHGTDGNSTDGGSADGSGDMSHTGDGVSSGDVSTDGGGDVSHTGDGVSPGDILCPPCAPPSSDDCVGSGPCGCGPYDCPGDADLICGGHMSGWCPAFNAGCECCPAGGPLNNCLCTTTCESNSDCTDPARPVCNQSSGRTGMCTDAEFVCCWKCL